MSGSPKVAPTATIRADRHVLGRGGHHPSLLGPSISNRMKTSHQVQRPHAMRRGQWLFLPFLLSVLDCGGESGDFVPSGDSAPHSVVYLNFSDGTESMQLAEADNATA